MTTISNVSDLYGDDVYLEKKRVGSSSKESIEKVYPALGSLLSQAIVFAALLLGGVTTFAVVSFAQLDWFFPALVYGFTLYVAWLKFFSGTQELADHVGSADSVNERLKLLEGRLLTISGYVLGEASMGSSSSLEPDDINGLEKAVSLTRRGYNLLREFGGPSEYMALNNFVFYSAALGDNSQADYLLSKARELLGKGIEHAANDLILTACRAILQFSNMKDERLKALEVLCFMQESDQATKQQRREAELYMNHFSPELSRQKSRLSPNPGPQADG